MSEIEVSLAPADVERLAQALALANGHSDPAAYAAGVAKTWESLAPKPAAPAGDAR